MAISHNIATAGAVVCNTKQTTSEVDTPCAKEIKNSDDVDIAAAALMTVRLAGYFKSLFRYMQNHTVHFLLLL